MSWILMLIGFLFGAMVDAELLGFILGAVASFAVRLRELEADNQKLRKELAELGERIDRGALDVPRAPPERPLPAARRVITEPSPVAPPQTTRAVPWGMIRRPPIDETAIATPTIATPTITPTAVLAGTDPTTAEPVIAAAPSFTAASFEPFAVASPIVIASPTESFAPPVASVGVDPAPLPPSRPIEPAPPIAPESPIPPELRPAAPEPPSPIEPPAPDPWDRAFAAARAWLVGGNPVLRIGVVLLFLGLAFLLRYASERGLVPIELRYAGVAAVAVALLGLGWWLRRRNPAYALILQGTGVAVLYLTVFAAIRLHPLIAPVPGLALLVAVTVGSAILAVTQNARGLAVVAAIGGFAAPILASSGGGNHVALFTYLAVLNTGILAIAWFKAWRLLNMIGFVGTFGIGLAWGLRSYTPALFVTTEPFLVLFFLMYVGIGLLFARRTLRDAADAPKDGERDELLRWSARQTDYVDGTVMFGPPMVGFGLQYAVVAHLEFGAAFSAAALGLFYVVLARLLAGRSAGRILLLVETCLALGVVFGTLAIPLGLDARWTSAAWAVEGAGLYWLGLRQQRPLARAFALLVQTGAAVAFLGEVRVGGVAPLLHGAPLGALMLGASLLFAHDRLRRSDASKLAAWESLGCPPLLACAGLAFVDMIAPLCLGVDGTVIAWAGVGLVTLFVGLRLRSRSYLLMALAVQLLGGALFMLDIRASGSPTGGVLGSGWRGLMTASWIGLALLAGVVIAARDPLVRDDRRLLYALTMMLLIGLGFINLAVLFVLPFSAASAVWGASGLVIVWLSLILRQRASFVFGLLLQAIGGAAFLLAGPGLLGMIDGAGLRPLAHAGFWTPAVLAVAALIGAWRLHRAAADASTPTLSPGALAQLSHLLLVWGSAWWGLTALCEIVRFVPVPLQGAALLLSAAGSVALWTVVALRSRWPAMALLCLTLAPLAVVVLALLWRPDYHPISGLGWLGYLAWPAVFAVHLASLRWLAALLPAAAASAAHVLGSWLIVGVLALELRFWMGRFAGHDNAWGWLGWALVPGVFLLLMAARRSLVWPVSAYPREYRGVSALVVAVVLLGWFWAANIFSAGDAAPLPYVPLVNPLELGLMFVMFAVLRWSLAGLPRLGARADAIGQPLTAVVGTSLFALLTAAVFRTAHHWGGVAYRIDALLASMLVQAGLSIVWTLVALGLMVSGHMRGRRLRWTVGAALIGAVVVKLFFVELGNSGGLARIVSFIGVGVLLLVVGYFAPLPPRRKSAAQEDLPV